VLKVAERLGVDCRSSEAHSGGWGVFGEDERQSTWLLMSSLLIGHHRNGDAFEDYFFLTLIYLSIIKFFSGQEEMRS